MQVNSSTCPRQNAWVVQRAVQTLLTLFGTLVLCPDNSMQCVQVEPSNIRYMPQTSVGLVRELV